MNRKTRCILLVLVTVLVAAGSVMGVMAAGSPGSEDDPVVTKSYVDGKLAELKGTEESGAAVFRVINVPAGKKVLGAEGTEMILRSGQATALDNGTNGISDLTDGKDLLAKTPIKPNHLLLIPGEDGRGIASVSSIWMMVKGRYTLQ